MKLIASPNLPGVFYDVKGRPCNEHGEQIVLRPMKAGEFDCQRLLDIKAKVEELYRTMPPAPWHRRLKWRLQAFLQRLNPWRTTTAA